MRNGKGKDEKGEGRRTENGMKRKWKGEKGKSGCEGGGENGTSISC